MDFCITPATFPKAAGASVQVFVNSRKTTFASWLLHHFSTNCRVSLWWDKMLWQTRDYLHFLQLSRELTQLHNSCLTQKQLFFVYLSAPALCRHHHVRLKAFPGIICSGKLEDCFPWERKEKFQYLCTLEGHTLFGIWSNSRCAKGRESTVATCRYGDNP